MSQPRVQKWAITSLKNAVCQKELNRILPVLPSLFFFFFSFSPTCGVLDTVEESYRVLALPVISSQSVFDTHTHGTVRVFEWQFISSCMKTEVMCFLADLNCDNEQAHTHTHTQTVKHSCENNARSLLIL